jgi:hypothetical protein
MPMTTIHPDVTTLVPERRQARNVYRRRRFFKLVSLICLDLGSINISLLNGANTFAAIILRVAMKRLKQLIILTVIVTAVATSLTACHRGASSGDETPDTSTYRPESTPATQFERDMKYVRDAHFKYVWIFTRKDGKELTREDSDSLRTNAPKVVDWVKTDQNRVIAGSNFPLEGPQVAALQKRFNIQDYSGK